MSTPPTAVRVRPPARVTCCGRRRNLHPNSHEEHAWFASANGRGPVRYGLPLVALGLVAALAAVPANASSAQSPDDDTAILMNYLINSAKDSETMDDVEAAVEAAGGEVITQYAQIGVTVAQSDRGRFAKDLRELDDLVQSVGATRTSAVFAPLAPKVGLDDLNRLALIDPEPREDEQWGN